MKTLMKQSPLHAIRIFGTVTLNLLMLSSIASATQTESLVQGNTAFALDLYGQLKNGPGNLFFSPYSISTALAMTYAGAHGDAEKQIGRVFHFELEHRKLQMEDSTNLLHGVAVCASVGH